MERKNRAYCPDCGYIYLPGEIGGPCGDCLHKAKTNDDRNERNDKKEDENKTPPQ